MNEQPKNYTIYGDKFWYLPSKGRDYCHRLDGPAIEWKNGLKEWFVDDKRHRSDGPAIEHVGGTKHWYVGGKLHRIDGPAIEYGDGTKHWYVGGKLHRIDGPAIERANGSKYWYLNGEQLPSEEVETWLEENNIDLTTEAGQMAFKLRWL